MGHIDHYRDIIRKLLREYSQYKPSRGDVQIELVKSGIPPQDIVLAFKEPSIRQYTGFAAA